MARFTSYRARFQGELAGIKADELRGLDYELEKFKDRKEFIEDKCEKIKPFVDEYFYNYKEKDDRDSGEFDYLDHNNRMYFNYRPKTTDELSDEINICKYLQAYGTYMMNSKDLPREKQQQYNILSEEEFSKVLQREKTLEVTSNGNAMDVLDQKPTNDYTNLNHRIVKSDFNDPEIKDVLNSYETYREHLKGEMQKIKNGEESYLDLYTIRSILSGVNDDMIQSKIKIKQIRNQAKRLGDESPYNDFSTLDYKNPEHIKHMLRFCKITRTPRPDNMTSHLGYDLHKAIDELVSLDKLDKVDLEIIECYNTGTYTQREIGRELEVSEGTIRFRLNRISKKISEVI